MSRPARSDTAELEPLDGALRPSSAVRLRRVRSARVRRRRLLLADVGIGIALGGLALILAPGLAIAALAALLVLGGCGLAALRERRSRRRLRIRHPRRSRRRRYHPKNSSAVS